jgi:putative lipoic acid-binding regulatory protein
MSRKTLLEFPAEFPIKVMGRHDSNLLALTRAIVERHAGNLEPERIRERLSSDGNFLAITYMITAKNQAQLDEIYGELTACDAVLMAL